MFCLKVVISGHYLSNKLYLYLYSTFKKNAIQSALQQLTKYGMLNDLETNANPNKQR